MKGLHLARDWLLLAAESALASPRDTVVDVHSGFPVHAERWAALGALLGAHAGEPDVVQKRLRRALGLSDAGYWLVLLVVAAEVYPEAAAAASILAEDERVQLVTPLVAARLLRAGLGLDFTDGLRETLPGAAARRLGLLDSVDVAPGRPTTQQGLRIRPDELAALLGEGSDLGRVRTTHVTRVAPATELAYGERLAAGAARLLSEKGVLGLRCESNRAGRQFALDVASALDQDALFVTVTDALPDLSDLARLRERAAVVLDLCGFPNERAAPLAFVEAATALLPSVIVLVPHAAATGTLPTLSVPPLGSDQSQRIWHQLVTDPEDVEFLSRRFRVNLEEARLSMLEAEDAARVEGETLPPSRARLTQAILAQGGRRMGRAVTRVALSVRLGDLVVPPVLERQVRDIIGWYSASPRVEREYGLRSARAGGPGLACLFSGQPGTGKTFAAQCIANELGLNLYRIDLSQVVSKYIGETEKALAQVFEEAEAGHGVLLFDEADALFGKRTEVKDAHDRYANVEVGYLLQRLETFSGIGILTTNLQSNIDPAFVRRLKFVLEFPVPDRDRREELWERALPARHLRRSDLDLRPFIERFRLSGGLIHNIGLAAAHLAATTADGLLGPEHVVQATFRELEKAGLARSPSDFGPLAHLLPGRAS